MRKAGAFRSGSEQPPESRDRIIDAGKAAGNARPAPDCWRSPVCRSSCFDFLRDIGPPAKLVQEDERCHRRSVPCRARSSHRGIEAVLMRATSLSFLVIERGP